MPEALLEACASCSPTLRCLRQPKMVDLLFNNLRWYYRYEGRRGPEAADAAGEGADLDQAAVGACSALPSVYPIFSVPNGSGWMPLPLPAIISAGFPHRCSTDNL